MQQVGNVMDHLWCILSSWLNSIAVLNKYPMGCETQLAWIENTYSCPLFSEGDFHQ